MNIFQKIKSFFSVQPERDSIFYPRLVLFEIRQDKIRAIELMSLNDHIKLWRSLGFQVEVIPLQTKIPDGYLGLRTVYGIGPQLRQAYLKMRSRHIEKIEIDFDLLDGKDHPFQDTMSDSNLSP